MFALSRGRRRVSETHHDYFLSPWYTHNSLHLYPSAVEFCILEGNVYFTFREGVSSVYDNGPNFFSHLVFYLLEIWNSSLWNSTSAYEITNIQNTDQKWSQARHQFHLRSSSVQGQTLSSSSPFVSNTTFRHLLQVFFLTLSRTACLSMVLRCRRNSTSKQGRCVLEDVLSEVLQRSRKGWRHKL